MLGAYEMEMPLDLRVITEQENDVIRKVFLPVKTRISLL
jgi:hypothetical protein